jgi:hypothetical protein
LKENKNGIGHLARNPEEIFVRSDGCKEATVETEQSTTPEICPRDHTYR